jgi:hypothetical protein
LRSELRAFLLKAGATVMTIAATVAAALFVTSHLKNPDAPLHPAVLTDTVTIGPAVAPSDIEPITSTYAS